MVMTDSIHTIQSVISDSIKSKEALLADTDLQKRLADVVQFIIQAYRNDRKVLFCGNGGSAADAQHLAAELSGRFYLNRKPLHAEALHTNTSHLTAVGNDFSFDEVYSRLVEANGRQGDILIAISTSGNSKNIICAVETANRIGLLTVGLTGSTGGHMKDLCRYLLNVPSTDTPRIQEMHILLGHILCLIVEAELFGQNQNG
jgi:D-sedoheptulose 7-phosphate isomerase